MDKINIKRLEVFAYHGVYEEENRLGQKFYVSVEMSTDTRKAGITDDLSESVNYGEVCAEVTGVLQNHRHKLIEAAAEDIASYLLTKHPAVRSVVVELEKPGAPVPYSFDTVSVRIERSRHKAYISVGSNMGDRYRNISEAVSKLEEEPDVRVTKQSSLYETKPYGFTDQPDFINGCIETETLKTPDELLSLLNSVESELGRTRDIHWGPRTADLDIIFYDDLICDSERLRIPHPDLANRMFVLKPLADIAGYVRHPVLNMTVDEMLAKLTDRKE